MFRSMRTKNEKAANSLHIREGIRVRRKRWATKLPDAYWDIRASRQCKSWKDRQKKRKQWLKKSDRYFRESYGLTHEGYSIECPTYIRTMKESCHIYICPHLIRDRRKKTHTCGKYGWVRSNIRTRKYECTWDNMREEWDRQEATRQEEQRIKREASREKQQLKQLTKQIQAEERKINKPQKAQLKRLSEKENTMNKFYFTFGSAHCDAKGVSLGNCYVELSAETSSAARDQMFDARAIYWSFIYESAKGAGVERFDLTKRTLESVTIDLTGDATELEKEDPFEYPGDVPMLPSPLTPEVIQKLNRKGAIQKKDLLIKGSYIGSCRNAVTATWDGTKFQYVREKFGTWFLEDINHYEDDNGYDLFIPIRLITHSKEQDKLHIVWQAVDPCNQGYGWAV